MTRENPTEVAVGAVVLLAALGFLAYAAQSTGLGAPAGDLNLTASFRSVEGVDIGTDVRLAGVRIGAVSAIALDPVSYRAETVMTLDRAVPIPDDSSAVVASEGLLGGNFIEILPGGSLDNLPDGAEIIDTQGAVSLLNLLVSVVGGSGDPVAP